MGGNEEAFARQPGERVAWFEEKARAIRDILEMKACMRIREDSILSGMQQSLLERERALFERERVFQEEHLRTLEDRNRLREDHERISHHLNTILNSPPYRLWLRTRALLPRPLRRLLGSPA
jgi:hypothetical protein